MEPCFGSGAVLLARPHAPKIETVNDVDCYLSNFWRAVQANAIEVARYADWPVNEADLHARHRWLVGREEFREKMKTDPDFYDVKIAGWWVWGLCCWIGGGWCREPVNGVWRQRPHLSHLGEGVNGSVVDRVHRKMPDVYARGHGKGVHRELDARPPGWPPDLQGSGRGINAPTRRRIQNKARGVHTRGERKALEVKRPGAGRLGGVHATGLPNLGSERGVLGADAPPCAEWFLDLQNRLRRVRVCCGDWKRVLGPSVIGTTRSRNSGMNPCGIFLDPPYGFEQRDPDLYASDSPDVAREVAAWAREHGDDPDLRIALCGYEGEHEMPTSWRCYAWKAHRGYAGDDNENVHRERIWFSPHCMDFEVQRSLFPELA